MDEQNPPFNPLAGDERIAKVAAHVGCSVADAEAAFGMLLNFNLCAAERSETGQAKAEGKKLRNEAAKFSAKFPHLTDIRDAIIEEAQVAEHFTDARAYPATKGRNERARIVAFAIARLFRSTGRNIGMGKSDIDGSPSTPFCRAVQHGLEAFGINAHWYQPAKDARDNTN